MKQEAVNSSGTLRTVLVSIEQGQAIGDVAGDAAAPFAEGVDEEADREDVGLVVQDVVLERTGEGHDQVVRQRGADHDARCAARGHRAVRFRSHPRPRT